VVTQGYDARSPSGQAAPPTPPDRTATPTYPVTGNPTTGGAAGLEVLGAGIAGDAPVTGVLTDSRGDRLTHATHGVELGRAAGPEPPPGLDAAQAGATTDPTSATSTPAAVPRRNIMINTPVETSRPNAHP
jgi:hypothetical protein